MNPKELRIGNLVNYPAENDNNEVENLLCKIDGADLHQMEGNREYAEAHQPIEITEEWLFNFGFLKMNSTWFTNHNRLRLNISFDTEWNGNWLGIRIKYVHQLQNLYFALTGEEFTYTPVI